MADIMRTHIIAYLKYMSTWETESDENINALITEQRLFENLAEFNFHSAINSEFEMLTSLANNVRDNTIAVDATHAQAYRAAVGAI